MFFCEAQESFASLGAEKGIIMKLSHPFRAGTKVLLSIMAVSTGVNATFTCTVNNTTSTTGYNATTSYLGCYLDPKVSILTAAKLSTIAMTPEYCATWCGKQGFAYGGIEFGT